MRSLQCPSYGHTGVWGPLQRASWSQEESVIFFLQLPLLPGTKEETNSKKVWLSAASQSKHHSNVQGEGVQCWGPAAAPELQMAAEYQNKVPGSRHTLGENWAFKGRESSCPSLRRAQGSTSAVTPLTPPPKIPKEWQLGPEVDQTLRSTKTRGLRLY